VSQDVFEALGNARRSGADWHPHHPVCKRSRSDGDDNSMTIGTVKWFNAEKGYGFIAPESGEDISCISARSSRLATARLLRGRSSAEGQVVEFDVTPGPKGAQAANVRLLEGR
jgi:cold shock protein